MHRATIRQKATEVELLSKLPYPVIKTILNPPACGRMNEARM